MSSTSIQSTDNQSFRATKSFGNRLCISHWFAKLHAQETGCQKCDFYQSGLSPAEKWGRLTSRPLIKCLRPPRIDLRVWLDSSCQFGQVSISQLSSDGQTGSDQLLEVKFFFFFLKGGGQLLSFTLRFTCCTAMTAKDLLSICKSCFFCTRQSLSFRLEPVSGLAGKWYLRAAHWSVVE